MCKNIPVQNNSEIKRYLEATLRRELPHQLWSDIYFLISKLLLYLKLFSVVVSPLLQEEMVKTGRYELKAETLALHRSQWRQFLLFWPLVTCDAAQF